MSIYPLSQTKLNMYTRCPYQFYCRYIKGLILPPAAALFAGGTVHETLAENYRFKLSSENTTDMPSDIVLDFFSDAWDKRIAIAEGEEQAIPEIDWGNDDPGELKDTCYKLVKLYTTIISPKILPIAVEFPFEKQIAGKGFTGRLDLILDSGYIADYKVTQRKWSDNQMKLELQPFAYAFGLAGEDLSDFQAIQFDYHFLEKTRVDCRVASLTKDSQDIEWFIDKATRDIEAIDKGDFPKRPNFLCENYCGYRQSHCGLRL